MYVYVIGDEYLCFRFDYCLFLKIKFIFMNVLFKMKWEGRNNDGLVFVEYYVFFVTAFM